MVSKLNNKYRLFSIILVLLLTGQNSHAAGSNDSITKKESPLKMAGFPLLGYTPETRIMGGIFMHLLYTGALGSHNSGIGLFTGISQNKQYTLNLQPDIWWSENKYHLLGDLKLQYWPDKFYGLGNETRDSLRENYTSRVQGVKLDLFRQIGSDLYAGPLLEIEHNNIIEYDDSPYADLPAGKIPGSDQSFIAGMGFVIALDSRNHVLYPAEGIFHQLRVVYFRNFEGAQSGYLKTIVDLRKYMALGGDHILRFQVYGKFQFGSDIPFRNLSMLGGKRLMRGYFMGRYRDNHILAIQAEYHTPYIWRFSGVLFAGFADVFGPYSDNQFSDIKPSGGIGLRFRFLKNEKLNLRMDAGFGKGDHGLYFHIGEAF